MHDYYYRDSEQEVIIQVTGNTKSPLSIRVTEDEWEGETITAMVNLPIEEIDHMIAALQSIKKKLPI